MSVIGIGNGHASIIHRDVTSIDLQCGGISSEGTVGSEPAPLHATAEAGSTVNLKWTLSSNSHMGPALTYMARCPDEGCDKWLPGEEPVFYKVHHDGRHTTDKSYPDDIWAVLIALHSAWAEGEAQFYPSCHQLRVTGASTVNSSEGLVSFPGAYKADDVGIFIDVWNPGNYTIPGPAVFQCL
ncbi:glycosyl hydrolase family 61-domain-containing protein [Chaetomium fimeti]|uniref:lytic cellulose monooxygenase (C4-dehydrogenating) n=1 Tax=Chaetomium fimeti TaxID=1854472 RepID=A0AAE0LU59_9PEZI|nr:glycosyl hydrolase family 61-domain-containing protein [Chaetomium fimeti]